MPYKYNPFLNSEYNEQNLDHTELEETIFKVKESVKHLRTDMNDAINHAIEILTSQISALSEHIQQLNTSANSKINTAVTTLNTSINTEVNTVNDRIDNIIAGTSDTESNRELIDIREDHNGTIHTSAGTSVRNITSKLDKKNEKLTHKIFNDEYCPCFDWKQGGISEEAGQENEYEIINNKRVCTVHYYSFNDKLLTIIPKTIPDRNIRFYCHEYDSDKTLLQTYPYNQSEILLKKGYLYRFSIADATNTSILINDFEQDNYVSLTLATDKQTRIITLGKTSGFDFNSLKAAINSIQNASKNNRYVIQIYPGEYDVLADYTEAELSVLDNSCAGPILPDYVDLVGIGNKKDIILKGYLGNNSTLSDHNIRANVSTLNFWRHNNIKNLTITMQNIRYCVHNDDFHHYFNSESIIEDCDFIAYQFEANVSATANSAYGMGVSSGSKRLFRNCNFYQYNSGKNIVNIHNNRPRIDTVQTEPCYVEFDNCRFIGIDQTNFFRVGNVSENLGDILVLKGCAIKNNGYLNFANSGGSTQTTIGWNVSGYANSIPSVNYSSPLEENAEKFDLI